MITKAQKPAVGILKRNDWGDAMTYQVVCECGDSNHDHNIWIEAEHDRIMVTIYTQQKSKWWSMNRWQKIWTLLTKGYIEYEGSIIMTEQQALNYTETLKCAILDVKQFKKERYEQN